MRVFKKAGIGLIVFLIFSSALHVRAQTSEQVKAINIGDPDRYDGTPRGFTEVDGKIFFTETGNPVLWISDGTEAGMEKLSLDEWSRVSLNNSLGSQSVAVLSDKLYFKNFEGSKGNLWVTDGTEAGSEEVVNLEDEGLMSITEFATFGNRVGFYALTESNTYNLYLIDETGTGIEQITEINDVPNEGAKPKIAVIDDKLFIVEEDGSDRNLVQINQDGTTTVVASLPTNSTEDDLQVGKLIAAGNKLFFEANDGTGFALWVYDTDQATLNRMFNPHEDAEQNRFATNITPVGNNVYFYSYSWDEDKRDFSNYAKLYISDGTSEGTIRIWNESLFGDGFLTNEPANLPMIEANGRLLFVAPKGSAGDLIWWIRDEATSSFEALTIDGEDIIYESSAPDPQTVSKGAWFANDLNLHFTDGTNEGTYKISSDDFMFIRHMRVINGLPWFSSSISGRYTETNVAWRVGNVEDLTPTKPVLLEPEDNANNASSLTSFSWEPGIVASEYDLQVSTDQDFTDILVNEESISDTSLTLPDSLGFETTYFWKVRGINGNNTGMWSDSLNFTTGPAPPEVPSLRIPSDEAIDFALTSTFYWDESEGAEFYRFQISTQQDFAETHTDTLVELDRFRLTDSLQTSTTYFWRVNAENVNGQSDWSEVRSLTTEMGPPGIVNLIEPEDEAGGVSRNPTFTWFKDDATEDYILHISEDDSFSVFTEVEFTEDTTVTLESSLDSNTLYYWRILPVNETGNGPYSEVREFTTQGNEPLEQVVLISPDNEEDSVSVTPDFEWEDAKEADSYQFQIAEDETFDNTIIDSTEIESASFFLQDSLQYSTNYFWRVRSLATTENGEWSDVWSFTTQISPPTMVELVSPQNESSVNGFETQLVWRQAPSADEYILLLADDEEFEEIVKDTTIQISESRQEASDTTYTINEVLAGYEDYFWKVQARNSSGSADWSEVYTFVVEGGLSTEQEDKPEQFTLQQNYPNPFNPTTQIRFGLPNASEVKLEVFNMLGQKVTTLVSEKKSSGWHSVTFDASNLSSGFYIYRIEANNFAESRKLLLIK